MTNNKEQRQLSRFSTTRMLESAIFSLKESARWYGQLFL